ncbi:MAG: N-acetyltransferase [Senegalia sp. (in: firmicutes)]|uniref:N-acetyltransferase n=1 Tax=Senegalia sp. (in: firmicutes) TaxID=1924098 RepID=UPI003F9BB7BD
MIKELDILKIDDVMKIWIEENIKAHDFISEEYWKSNYDYVKNVLPDSTVFVYEENNEIKGFIGVMEKSYIAGLFVSNKYHSNGIGEKLLNVCKKEYPTLRLNVYAKNLKAVKFYKKHEFKIYEEKKDNKIGEIEYSMIWNLSI